MLYPVITPVALPGCYFPLIFTTHFLCALCLLCSLMLLLGRSLLVPLQFCCYELANTRLRGVVEFGMMWSNHGYSTIVSEQLFFFTKARGGKFTSVHSTKSVDSSVFIQAWKCTVISGCVHPPDPSHHGRGSWERGPKSDLSERTQTAEWLCCPKLSYGEFNMAF